MVIKQELSQKLHRHIPFSWLKNLKTGDEIEILPSKKRCRVRGIQVHNHPAKISVAGQRTAVNLQGVEKREVQRGEVLIHPGTMTPTQRLDGYLTMLPTAEHPITHASTHRFHVGTSLHLAKIYLLDSETLGPSDKGFVQFVFTEPVITLPGDRFVIRGSGKIQTLGGGEILTIHPPRRKRNASQVLKTLHLLKDGTDREKVQFFIQDSGLRGITFSYLMEQTNFSRRDLNQILEAALKAKEASRVDLTTPVYIHFNQLRDLSQKIEKVLKNFHMSNPLKEGMEKEVLRSQIAPETDKKFWDHLLTTLSQDGIFVVEQESIRLKGHQKSVDPDFQKTIEAITASFEKAGSHPPTLKELAAKFGKRPEHLKPILTFLVKEGKCVKLTEEIYMDTAAFEEIKKESIEFLKKNGELTVQSFKELTGLSRKFAVPILELLDKQRITIRIDQKRVLRG
jgi:selenocysteine-specific elongation factor